MEGKHTKFLCVLWAGLVYCSAFLYSGRPHVFCSLSTMLKTKTASTIGWTDYFIWFACRGFHLFSFAVFSWLLLRAFSVLQRWTILAFLPAFGFAVFEQWMRHFRWPTINQVSLLILDAIGILIGIWVYVRTEMKKEMRFAA